MLILQPHPELLLHLLQRFNRCASKCPKQVKQVHSLLITHGYLLIRDLWVNTLLYNTLIRTYLNLSRPHTSLSLFREMLHSQAAPNSYTFPSVLKAIASLSKSYGTSRIGYSLHAQCVERGLLDDPFVRTSFLSLYSQFGDIRSAHKVFDEIPQPCIVSNNAMLDAFGKGGNMDLAISMFFSMPKRDVYSWTTIINGYAQNGCFMEAIRFFIEMMRDEDVIRGLLRPSEATFVSVLSSCANSDDGLVLYQGKQIHGYMVRIEKELSVFSGTALISFYGKMGCLSYAFKVFNGMSVKKVCAWNAMLCSLALNGRESLALEMFEKMKSLGLCPNEVTFVCVLSACARAKLVELGMELFQAISRDFSITPTMEHYGCVVDLLGRAGLLKEAYEFVRSMPFEADASVLGALLGACRVHGDVDLGNEVGQRLLELQPNHCGRYVLLSSIYAGAEIWDHAAALRKAMVHAGIRKVPAISVAD
ncbi:putative pentatricopeptide repeat-containing protein At1g10330 [Salvia miltiorrhiza]|uniref:putative pentatricopeptide repeat-containing protein At1g10330 n=1 Tax=Salvia miltiorrhiza TaxID=226208 RepID=UPI0025ACA63E|nr:putative pentatricopeptide repeat-containing protein At1g10330 [Salvia miltiorrhiza]XP_057799262.1 putative pentatricopeptide repeat-containing protein At1g10330 [Salvia miltiorrhiza]XP_057799263.1 putative pentatricopeptide repeat-containing protein At1g10330 [Salvia miltiorrhiza]